MFTNVSIRGFQSLRKLDLDLGKFTVVTGTSSNGKSALIRALSTITSYCSNVGYITSGLPELSVSVKTHDGQDISFKRNKTSSEFRINNEVFTKLSRTVPDQVFVALNANRDACGLCVNSQFDSPFLVGDTGANVAKILGKFYDFDTILDAISIVNSHSRRVTSQITVRNKDLDRIKEDLDSLNQVYDSCYTMLTCVSDQTKELVKKNKEVEYLRRLLSEVEEVTSVVRTLSGNPVVETHCLEEFREDNEEIRTLSSVVSALLDIQNTDDIVEFRPALSPDLLLDTYNNVLITKDIIARIMKVATSYKTLRDTIQRSRSNMDRIKGSLDSMLNSLKVCPTCERGM